MTLYRVEWAIEVEADDPHLAAAMARHYQTKPGTTAKVFDVFEPVLDPPESGGPSMLVARIDLAYPDRSEHFTIEQIRLGQVVKQPPPNGER